MNIFASIVLIIIVIIIQHLLNWLWRYTYNKNDNLETDDFAPLMFLTFICFLITVICIKYIVLWLYPVIT